MTDAFDLRAVLDADDDDMRPKPSPRAYRNPVTSALGTETRCTAGGAAGCDRPVAYGGLCEGHIQRKRRGAPLDTPLKFRNKTRRACKVEGCNRIHAARGYCGTHYDRLRLGKDIDAPIPVFRKRNIAYRCWGQAEWTAEVAEALDAAHSRHTRVGKNAFLEILIRAQLASMGYLAALEREGL